MGPFSRLSVGVFLLGIALGVVAGYNSAEIQARKKLEHNKELVRMNLQNVWSERNTQAAIRAARSMYTPDFVDHDWTGDSTGGFDEFAKGLAENRASFPDWTETIEALVAEGDFVAVRSVSTGTQAADLPAVPHIQPRIPNKNRFSRLPELAIYRISDGKLAEEWNISDGWDANRQLGLFDPDHWPVSVCSETHAQ